MCPSSCLVFFHVYWIPLSAEMRRLSLRLPTKIRDCSIDIKEGSQNCRALHKILRINSNVS